MQPFHGNLVSPFRGAAIIRLRPHKTRAGSEHRNIWLMGHSSL